MRIETIKEVIVGEGSCSAKYREDGEILVSLSRPLPTGRFSTIDFLHPTETQVDDIIHCLNALKEEIVRLKSLTP